MSQETPYLNPLFNAAGKYGFLLLLLWGSQAALAQPCAPQVNLGSNIAFCSGNTITLDAFWPNSSYQWSTGDTTPQINVTSSGIYGVQVTNSCGTGGDTIQITASQPVNVNLGANRSFCANSPLSLSAPLQSSTNYTWSNNSSSNSITVSQGGTYWVEATNSCGTYRDTVQLQVDSIPNVSLGPDILECQDSTVTIPAPSTQGSVLWSTSSTADSLVVAQSGTYWFALTNSCGTFRDTIQVDFQNDLDPISPENVQLCPGSSVSFGTNISGSYQWSHGPTSPQVTVNTPGSYVLTINTACGSFKDTVLVQSPSPLMPQLGPDTLLCAGQSLNLDPGTSSGSFLWSTSATSPTISVSQAGTYWVRVSNGCNYFYDTIQVSGGSFPVQPFPDTLLYCTGGSLTVDASSSTPGSQYRWSTSSTSATETFSSLGNYWVAISNGCGQDTFFFQVVEEIPPTVNITPDSLVSCQSISIMATGLGNLDTLLWAQPNGNIVAQGQNPLIVNSSGTYIASVSNSCGTARDSVVVQKNRAPQRMPDDTITICSNAIMTVLTAPSQPNPRTRFSWSTGDTTRSTTVSGPGIYTITIRNQCDTVSSTIVVQSEPPLSFDLGSDTTICEGQQVNLDVSSLPADSIRWSDGSQQSLRQINYSDTLILSAYNACGVQRDTISITRILLPREQLQDTAFCQGSSLTLDAGQPQASSYLWNTQASSASITINTPGWYYCTISNSCGSLRDSVRVTVDTSLGTVDLGPDTIFCSGTLTLDAGQHSGASYRWQDGSTQDTFQVRQSGSYHVTVNNACGVRQDTIQVLITGPPVAILGNSVTYCRNNTLTLNAQNPGSSYQWNTGDTTQSITVSNPGLYWVEITNDCGTDIDTVRAVPEAPLSDLNLGPDTTICQGDTLELFTGYPGQFATWSDNSHDSRLEVYQSGTYWVRLSNACGIYTDTIELQVNSSTPPFSLAGDTVLCEAGDSLQVKGPDSLASYQWSTGDTSRSIWVKQGGNYALTVTNFCGYTSSDSLTVEGHRPLNPDLGPDTVLCAGSTYELDPGISDFPITWNTGLSSPTLTVDQGGIYVAQSRNACGTFTSSVRIAYRPEPSLPDREVEICKEDSLLVDPEAFMKESSFDFSKYTVSWQDGYPNLQRALQDEGVYTLEFQDRCATYSQDFRLQTDFCDCPIFFPNAFTPNGDGVNDSYRIQGACEFEVFHLRIFNRWGQLVFESEDRAQDWDGQKQGQRLPEGTYTYYLYYEWSEVDRIFSREKRGTITLLR